MRNRNKNKSKKKPDQVGTFGSAPRFQDTFTTKTGLQGRILRGREDTVRSNKERRKSGGDDEASISTSLRVRTDSQTQSISQVEVRGRTLDQIRSLTLDQVRNLPNTQINALNDDQIRVLSASQLAALSLGQIQALEARKLQLFKEQEDVTDEISLIVQKILKQVDEIDDTEILSIVSEWYKTSDSPDPMLTYRFMKTSYMLSQNKDVQQLLQDGRINDLKILVRALENSTVRGFANQILRDWSDNPKEDIAQRGLAFEIFRNKLLEIQDNEKHKTEYLEEVLDHNKGYAQVFDSTQKIFEDFQLSQTDKINNILIEDTNTGIWNNSQSSSLKSEIEAKQFVDDDEQIKLWDTLIQRLFKEVTNQKEYDNVLKEIKLKSNADDMFRIISELNPNLGLQRRLLDESIKNF